MRGKILAFAFFVVFISLIGRLFYWQVIRAKELSDQARKQYQIGYSVSAPRGNILASDGSWYAGRGDGWLVYAALPEIDKSINEIADSLSPFFVDINIEEDASGRKEKVLEEANKIKSLLAKEEVVWVPLKHKISLETKEQIEALAYGGVGFEKEDIRLYPEASSAAQLLGFVGKNEEGQDQGYFGLEGHYDLILSGKPGFISRDSDALGIPISVGDTNEVLPVEGVDILTHLDKAVQMIIEEALIDGIEKYGAKAGSVVVMNPKNGGILAMSSYPSYDPLEYYKYGDKYFKNPVVSDSFEPGSVFKVLIMAAALDADAVEADTKCDICTGPLKIDKYSIGTWDGQYYPDSTMKDVIVHSDNVGMTFVGERLGEDRLYDYLSSFGIGELSGIDLQGEMTPKLREKGKWGIVDVATASFGQGVAITPIQLVKAVSAIANDGVLLTPQVADKLVGENWEEDITPENGKRVISADAASDITSMMVEAARSGEAKWTHVGGFNVAGKTGTAQIPISGHYDENKTIASFIGFAPADDPKYLMLVTLREPTSSPWSSETAAPLWYTIAKDLFLYYGIQPTE